MFNVCWFYPRFYPSQQSNQCKFVEIQTCRGIFISIQSRIQEILQNTNNRFWMISIPWSWVSAFFTTGDIEVKFFSDSSAGSEIFTVFYRQDVHVLTAGWMSQFADPHLSRESSNISAGKKTMNENSFTAQAFRKIWEYFDKIKSSSKQWIKRRVVNFICETKSVSKQDVLIMVRWPNKLCNELKPCFPSWLLFPVFIESNILVFLLKLILSFRFRS